MEYSDGGGRRRVDLISNTVLDILAGDDEDDGEAVGAGTEAVGCTSESEPARSFAAASSSPGLPRHLQRFGAARVHVPARRGSTCHSRPRPRGCVAAWLADGQVASAG